MQNVDPEALEKDPEAQTWHIDELRALENLPVLQGEHAADPFTSLYVPALHATQSVPTAVWPTLHSHDALSDLE